jgi:LuxR family glucitol operon transcriptional activator
VRFLGGKLSIERKSGDATESVELGKGILPVALVVGLATQKDLQAPPATTLRSLCYEAAPPIRWKESLEAAISRLRHKRHLPIANGSWRLESDPDDVDVLLFERLAKQAVEDCAAGRPDEAVKLADEALALWTIDPAVTFADHPLLASAFERFRTLRRRLLRARARALLDLGRNADAQDMLDEAMREDPTDGRLAELLDEARARTGDTRAATGSVRNNLPLPDPQPLLGRDAQVAAIREVLRPYPHSQHGTLTVDGVGGVGKTALVKHVAYSYLEAPGSDDAFVAVIWTSAKLTALGDHGVQAKNPTLRNLEDIYSAIATTLQRPDVMAAPTTEHPRLIRELLSEPDRRVLLVIDNLETVDDERVTAFLRDLPAPTKALITTRHRLDGALPIRLEGLEPPDAEALVRHEAAQHVLELSDETVRDLATAAAGVPLAIIWTVGQIAQTGDAQDALLRLRSASGAYAEFSFRGSVQHLEETAQRDAIKLLYAAALFADDASREALGFVAGMPDAPVDRDRALARLTGMSLVNHRGSRYSLLPLTREFVLGEYGRDLTLREPSVERWLAWHRHLATKAAAGGADLDSTVLDSLRREYVNVLWAIDHSMRNDGQDFVPLVRSMEFFWLGEGLWGEFEHYLERARTFARLPEDKVHFTARLMWLAVLRDDLEAADELRSSCELLLRKTDVPYERMRLADFTGQALLAAGHFDAAEPQLLEALRLATELDDRRGQFATCKYLGELCCARGNATSAKVWLERAEVQVGDPQDVQWLRGLAHLAHLEGRVAEVAGRLSEAEAAYRECLRLLGFHPDARLRTRSQYGLASVLHAQRSTVEAVEELAEVVLTFEQLGMWQHADRIRQTAASWVGGAP